MTMAPDESRAAPTPHHVLETTGVTMRFGGLTALSDVTIDVPAGTIVGLVGPNGAGKSTLFGVMSGLLRPASGRVFIDGRDVTTLKPQMRARLGLARTFQHPELFMGLTVRDHLVLTHGPATNVVAVGATSSASGVCSRPRSSKTEQVDAFLELLGLTNITKTRCRSFRSASRVWSRWGGLSPRILSVVLLREPLSGLDVNQAEADRSVRARHVRVAPTGCPCSWSSTTWHR